jgi:hypothetical protein
VTSAALFFFFFSFLVGAAGASFGVSTFFAAGTGAAAFFGAGAFFSTFFSTLEAFFCLGSFSAYSFQDSP